MPILGATDRASTEARYPLVGRLYKGGPKRKRKRGDKEYLIFGLELKHFRFVSTKAGALEAFTTAFGKEPTKMVAYLPYPTAEECFSTWIELWSGGGRLLYRSDGVRTVRRWLADRKMYSDRAEDQVDHPGHEDERWVGRFPIFFPELLQAGYPGTVMLTTHGKHDCVRISATLYALERDFRWRENGLAGVEVILSRQEIEHTDPEGKKRKHWDVFVDPSERIVLAALERARNESANLLTEGTRLIDAQTGEVLIGEEVNHDEQSTEKVAEEKVAPPKKRAKARKKVEPPNGANGKKVTRAAIKGCTRWRVAANELADATPFYMGESGPDFPLMLQAAADLLYTEVTDDNLDAVMDALTKHAAEPESEGPPEGVLQQEIPF